MFLVLLLGLSVFRAGSLTHHRENLRDAKHSNKTTFGAEKLSSSVRAGRTAEAMEGDSAKNFVLKGFFGGEQF